MTDATADTMDLGQGVTAQWLFWDGQRAGLVYQHPRPDGRQCEGSIMFDLPETRQAYGPDRLWAVESWDPLTVSPSLLCGCQHHGFIRNGRWEPA